MCQSKYLSLGDWVVLIRLVLNSIPVYQMLVNNLPKKIMWKLPGLFSHFIWGGTGEYKKMHSVK